MVVLFYILYRPLCSVMFGATRHKQNKLINLLRKISGQIGIPACPSYPIENAISIYVLHAYMAIALPF